MSYRHGEKRGNPVLVVLVVIVLLLLTAAAILYTNNPIKRKIVSMMVDKMIEDSVGNDQDSADGDLDIDAVGNDVDPSTKEKAEKILDSMSEEDKEAVTDIITENLTPSTVNDVSSYVENHDAEGLMDYAKENLSEEDYDKVQELYKKYMNGNEEQDQ